MNTDFDSSFFDVEYDRCNTGSVKYGEPPAAYPGGDVIPMWVADMDFKSPPEIEQAMIDTARHGIYGYTNAGAEYDSAVVGWYKRRMNVELKPEWIIKVPTVMFGISAAVRALSDEGDAVMICQPVYHPFSSIILSNRRKPIVLELRLNGGRYEIDFDAFERKITENSVKIFLLCSPHNPVGRVWTKSELEEISRICLKHGVYIISDEIHSDFIFSGHRHIPIASISEETAQRTVTCTAPTKTFNIAGIQAANIFIPNENIRKKVYNVCRSTGYNELNAMAIAATKAAYNYGEPWLNSLVSYLEENVKLMLDSFPDKDGKIIPLSPEGTYLMWADCRRLGLSDRELEKFFIEKTGIWLHNGITFGKGGSGFVRINIACPHSVLRRAIQRLKREGL